MLRKIKSHLAILLMLALAFTLLIPAPVQAASKKKPAKVTVTSVKTSGTNKVVVKWKKAKYATNYRIYWKQAGTKKWRTLATVKSNKTTYTHKSNNKARLVAGKKYVYTVRAYNKYGKKWGSYNTKGKTVMIPKKKAAPPATAPVKPKPTTQTPAKPTATLVPVKPTEAPKPTATPVPVKPTEAPKPTATPAPVKVSSVTINPSTLKLTSKGQTAQLSASVLPNNAENKSIVWSTSNASVATVDNNGVVTAVANGNATITAAALDGSGKYAECSVVVEIPKENNQIIELAGSESKKIGITKSSFPEITDFSKVTFDCKNSDTIYEICGFDNTSRYAAVTIQALRQGNGTITANYDNKIIARWTINVTSNWDEYIGYVNWRKQVESQIWTSGMSVKEKCDAAKEYIKTNFTYKLGYCQGVLIYEDKMCDCIGASNIMGDFAKDINCTVGYVNMGTDTVYTYLSDAVSAGGNHIFTVIQMNGAWESYDAQPQHN